jgi:hypothetical protein
MLSGIFWRRDGGPVGGYRSQFEAGNPGYEMTHFTLAGATKDPKKYGPDEAKRLAASNSIAAQQNAENFEYCVEALVFGL